MSHRNFHSAKIIYSMPVRSMFYMEKVSRAITRYPWSWIHGWKYENRLVLCIWMNDLPAPNAVLSLLSCDCKRRCVKGKRACMVNDIKCTDMYRYVWQPTIRRGRWWGGWPRWRWNRPWWGRRKLCYRLWLAYYFYDFFTLFNITLVETLFTDFQKMSIMEGRNS